MHIHRLIVSPKMTAVAFLRFGLVLTLCCASLAWEVAAQGPQSYWGPMEPTGNAHAGLQMEPGEYQIVYAVVPRTATSSGNWRWGACGQVKLTGGHRYFIEFNRAGQALVYDETSLPAEERQVRAPAGAALVWYRNNSGKRIATGFRRIMVGANAPDHPPASASAQVSGTYAIIGNGYRGTLEISNNGGYVGRVRFDIYGRWENLTRITYVPATRTISFTRPITGATQAFTGKLDGRQMRGTFTQVGTKNVYQWEATRR